VQTSNKIDLPAPLGPNIPEICPFFIPMLTLLNEVKPFECILVMPSKDINKSYVYSLLIVVVFYSIRSYCGINRI